MDQVGQVGQAWVARRRGCNVARRRRSRVAVVGSPSSFQGLGMVLFYLRVLEVEHLVWVVGGRFRMGLDSVVEGSLVSVCLS